MATVGARVREARQKLSLQAAALAERAGITTKALSEIENDKVEPRPETVRKLAEALGMPVHLLQPQARGEDVLVMLYRSLTLDKQKWIVQQLAAMAAGMEAADDFSSAAMRSRLAGVTG